VAAAAKGAVVRAPITNDLVDAAFDFGAGCWSCFHAFADDLGAFDRAWRIKHNGVVVLYRSRPHPHIRYPRAAVVRAARETKGDPIMWELADVGVLGLLRRCGDTHMRPEDVIVRLMPVTGRQRSWVYVGTDEPLVQWIKKEFLRR
jgi:hypothetical protein